MTGYTSGQVDVRRPTRATAMLHHEAPTLPLQIRGLGHHTSQEVETKKCFSILIRWIRIVNIAEAMEGTGTAAKIDIETIGKNTAEETMIGGGGAGAAHLGEIGIGTQMTGGETVTAIGGVET